MMPLHVKQDGNEDSNKVVIVASRWLLRGFLSIVIAAAGYATGAIHTYDSIVNKLDAHDKSIVSLEANQNELNMIIYNKLEQKFVTRLEFEERSKYEDDLLNKIYNKVELGTSLLQQHTKSWPSMPTRKDSKYANN